MTGEDGATACCSVIAPMTTAGGAGAGVGADGYDGSTDDRDKFILKR